MDFKLQAPYIPTGDQPEAIRQLVEGVNKGYRDQVLLGATGTGKTFTMANIIQNTQMPALIMAHNKTLAAQLYSEFKEFFPENAVEYFVSYYDYFQPEAYVPRHDLYIEKETDINEEIDRMRLAATMSLMSRKDVIIIASVSCIYGLGNPENYGSVVVNLDIGGIYRRNALLRQLIESQYQRNDMELKPGAFRVRGDTIEIFPAYEEKKAFRLSFFGDEVEKIVEYSPLTGEIYAEPQHIEIYPAKHYIASETRLKQAITDIETELNDQVKYFNSNQRLLEAQRIEQRCRYDLEMLKEVGYCSGIENYSRHLDQRPAGSAPWTLMDYLPSDYLLFLDESHMTVPQIRGMYNGDQARKSTLVEYGFRLPSALDNRPLTFDEFERKMGYTIYTSATPADFEMKRANQVVEQIDPAQAAGDLDEGGIAGVVAKDVVDLNRFGQGDGVDRAGRDAGAAAGTGAGIDVGQGGAALAGAETDGAFRAIVVAGAAFDAVAGQAAIGYGQGQLPGGFVGRTAQGRGRAGLVAGPAEGAFAPGEVHRRVTAVTGHQDGRRAGRQAVAAAAAGGQEGRLGQGPGRADRGCRLAATAQEAPASGVDHGPYLAFSLSILPRSMVSTSEPGSTMGSSFSQ